MLSRYGCSPSLLGEDVVSLAWVGGGVALTGAVNDKVVSPVLGRFLPASFANELLGKVVDAASTVITAWGLGEVVGMVDRGVGRKIRMGGAVLAVGKGISIVLPGFSLSGTLPGAVSSRIPSLVQQQASKELAAGNGGVASMAQLGVGQMGL